MSEQPVLVQSASKPGKVQAIEIILLVSGILNIIGGLSASFAFLVSIVGIICVPITLLPLILGVFEVLYASKLMSGKPLPAQNIKTIAILEIATILYGNVPGLVAGILNLVFLDDAPVKAYLE